MIFWKINITMIKIVRRQIIICADYPDGAKTCVFDGSNECDLPKWHPSIHMPKEGDRIR